MNNNISVSFIREKLNSFSFCFLLVQCTWHGVRGGFDPFVEGFGNADGYV